MNVNRAYKQHLKNNKHTQNKNKNSSSDSSNSDGICYNSTVRHTRQHLLCRLHQRIKQQSFTEFVIFFIYIYIYIYSMFCWWCAVCVYELAEATQAIDIAQRSMPNWIMVDVLLPLSVVVVCEQKENSSQKKFDHHINIDFLVCVSDVVSSSDVWMRFHVHLVLSGIFLQMNIIHRLWFIASIHSKETRNDISKLEILCTLLHFNRRKQPLCDLSKQFMTHSMNHKINILIFS